MRISIRLSGAEPEMVLAQAVGDCHAQLLDIPRATGANIYDVVRYDLESRQQEEDGISYRMLEVVEPSGYRAYLTWAVIHKPRQFHQWRSKIQRKQIVIQVGEWVNRRVRHLIIALPPDLSALEALVLFNRHSAMSEIICPLLAAHANDLDRAKSDLERTFAWGAPKAELTLAVAEAFEQMKRLDEAMPFWERLAHDLMPDSASMRERIAISYARLGAYPQAAHEFDYAAFLTEEPDHRRRLEQARDLMWKRSKI